VAQLLDPSKALFGTRIVSRDDCPDLQARSKSLQRLFPGGIETALIVDDTPGVWQVMFNEQKWHDLSLHAISVLTLAVNTSMIDLLLG